ncbi:family 2 glycosyl transferase [Chondrocystis sp. NIES-4102]|nr:family 2 glycosyl transferase [Chondrocystis sp. NIES-4102]
MNLLSIINLILLLGGCIVIIPCLTFMIECLGGFFATKSEFTLPDIPRPKITVLIPAHNEAEQIQDVLKVLLQQITPEDQVIVIADNCHDNTAQLARDTGVTVIERENKTHRGKGYALDYAMQKIKDNPPEVLVILDGDCIIAPNTLQNIAYTAIATGRPVQATYLMDQPEDPSLKDNISMFSLKVKNLVRLLGLNRLGWHCLLTGSGMAFPWSLINQVSLAGSKTTDDTQLTVDLTLARTTPVFCEDALVMGRLMKGKDAQSQRSRWEHGQLEMILIEVPRLLKAFVTTGNWAALGLALDIAVPPLSLLVMTWMLSMTVTLVAAIIGGVSIVPAIIVSVAGLFLFTGVLLAWVKFGRSDLPLQNLLAIPFYMLSKIPIYLNFLIKPQSRWLKTERDLSNN